MIEFSNTRNPRSPMGTIGYGRGDDNQPFPTAKKIGPKSIRNKANEAVETLAGQIEACLDKALANLTEFTGVVEVDVGFAVTNLVLAKLRQAYCEGPDAWSAITYEPRSGGHNESLHIVKLHEHYLTKRDGDDRCGSSGNPMDR